MDRKCTFLSAAMLVLLPLTCKAADYVYNLAGINTLPSGKIVGSFTIHIDDSGIPSITQFAVTTKKVFSKNFSFNSRHCKHCFAKITVGQGPDGEYDQGISFTQLLKPLSGNTYNVLQFYFTEDQSNGWGSGANTVYFTEAGSTNPPPSLACSVGCGDSGGGNVELTSGSLTLQAARETRPTVAR